MVKVSKHIFSRRSTFTFFYKPFAKLILFLLWPLWTLNKNLTLDNFELQQSSIDQVAFLGVETSGLSFRVLSNIGSVIYVYYVFRRALVHKGKIRNDETDEHIQST